MANEIIRDVPTSDQNVVPQAAEAAQPIISAMPEELGRADVDARIAANEKQRAAELQTRDQKEVSVGPSTVRSVTPPGSLQA